MYVVMKEGQLKGHDTEESAVAEATRLAEEKGGSFLVLEAKKIARRSIPPVTVVDFVE